MKKLLFIIGMCVICAASMAQPPSEHLSPERMKEIRAQKSAYLTARLSLTPEEAQRFWPVYNEYDERTSALRRELHDLDRRSRNGEDTLTEADANAFMEQEIENRQKELDLLRRFQSDSKRLIGAVRTVELGRAERDFHREMLKRYRESGKGSRPERR